MPDNAPEVEHKHQREAAPLKQAPQIETPQGEALVPGLIIQAARSNPGSLHPADVLALQRQVGNRAVSRLLGRAQPKLTVGAADDPYEREADQVAERVVSGALEPAAQRQDAPEEEEVQTLRVQRLGVPEEEEVQTLRIQRQAEEEDEVQTVRIQRAVDPLGSFETDASIEDRIRSGQGSGAPLDGTTRGFMEQRFGADFSGVRLHSGSESGELNRSIHAQAFTLGQDIYLGEGASSPGSSTGKRLLAHELTHVLQQGGARRTARQASRFPIRRYAGPMIRRLMSLADWKNITKISGRDTRPGGLGGLDTAVENFHTNKDGTIDERKSALDGLDTAIGEWLSAHSSTATGSKALPKSLTLSASVEFQLSNKQVTKLAGELGEEKQKFAIVKTINDEYGVLLKQSRGVDIIASSIRRAAPTMGTLASNALAKSKVKLIDWTLEELESLKQSLDNYGPELKRQKSDARRPLKSVSREDAYQKVGPGGAVTASGSTMGVTYMGRDHISMFTHALAPVDFATPMQEFRGTIEHELSHALIEDVKMPDYLTAIPFWRSSITPEVKNENQSIYWVDASGAHQTSHDLVDEDSSRENARKKGIEPPPTDYGTTNAGEDLAETMMMFFEDPGKLAVECPNRFNFITSKVAPLISAKAVEKARKQGVQSVAAAIDIGSQTDTFKGFVTAVQAYVAEAIKQRDLAQRGALMVMISRGTNNLPAGMIGKFWAESAATKAAASALEAEKVQNQAQEMAGKLKYLFQGWSALGSDAGTALSSDVKAKAQAQKIADTRQKVQALIDAVKTEWDKAREAALAAQQAATQAAGTGTTTQTMPTGGTV